MTTPDMLRLQSTHPQSFSQAEPLLSAVSATLPKGDPTLDPKVMERASNFPLAAKIVLALTPHRVLVFKSGWGTKPGGLLGFVDLNRVKEIEIVWNRKLAILAFGFHDAPPVAMRAVSADAAEHFRLQFLTLRGRI